MTDNSTHAAAEAIRRTEQLAAEAQRQATTADLVSCVVGLDRGVGRRALVDLGFGSERLLGCLGSAPPEADHLLRAAISLARRMGGSDAMTTGHLLLAALSDPTAAATQALAGIGLHAAAVRTEIADLVDDGMRDDAPPLREVPGWILPSADIDAIDTAISLTISAAPDLRLRIGDLRADPSGFEFRLELRAAPGSAINLPPWRHSRAQGLQLRCYGSGGAEYGLIDHRRARSQWPLCGMVVAAGPAETTRATLQRRVDYVMWCWPLPPPGVLDVECIWLERDIHTRHQIDADQLRRAAAKARPSWPSR